MRPLQRRRDTGTARLAPVVIRARAAERRTEDGRPIHTITIATRENVSDRHMTLDIENLDIESYMQGGSGAVLFQHDPYLPVAKTLALRKVDRNGRTEIDADFAFDRSSDNARQVEQWWDDGIINAASINFDYYPVGDERAGQQFMTEWSLTPIPADQAAVKQIARMARSSQSALRSALSSSTEEVPLEPKELVAALQAALKDALGGTQRSGDGEKLDATALATALAPALGTMVETATAKAVEGVQAKLTEAQEATEKARAAADAEKKKRDEEMATAVAGERARSALLVKAAPFLPQDFDASKATARSILETAMTPVLGPEVAKEKPEAYLEAYLDVEIKNRTGGGQQTQQGGGQVTQRAGGGFPNLGGGGQLQAGDPWGGGVQGGQQNGMAGLQQLQFDRSSRAFAFASGDDAVAMEQRADGVTVLRNPELDQARENARAARENAWRDPVVSLPAGVAAPAAAGNLGQQPVTLQQMAALLQAAGAQGGAQ